MQMIEIHTLSCRILSTSSNVHLSEKQVKRSFTNTSRRNYRGLNFLKKEKKEKKEKNHKISKN